MLTSVRNCDHVDYRESEKCTFWHETGCNFKIENGNQGEDWHKDQEVDLGRRCSQSIGVVPVGN